MSPGTERAKTIRILLLADTHLGFDSPQHPRVRMRRRGPDFFANFKRALRPAMRGEIDLVVHAGDLFFRSKVPAALLDQALTPLAQVAQSSIPVFLVPGNHERSRIPLHLATATPNLHIFHRPGTVVLNLAGTKISVSGFPFARHVGERFDQLLGECEYSAVEAEFRLLCLHQSVEGAKVGVQGYTFRRGPEVISGQDIPVAFHLVLAGHIHRNQLLTQDLAGRPLPAPVVYPGAIERTSFAEREETKHYARVDLTRVGNGTGVRVEVEFVPLPTRPMVDLRIDGGGLDADGLMDQLSKELGALDPHAIVRVNFASTLDPKLIPLVSSAALRSLAPATMNVSLAGRT
ncbi:MAG: DNA repair exonuclease [Chloroflexota bacterium]|nr:MAG: DNA repair exonuclease [Chloroflexota bacterium]